MQDDWRISSKLTLNLGLRWEIETALTERNDKSVSGFDYGYVQPIEGTVQARYAALNDPALKALVPQLSVKGGLMFAGVDGSSRLYETPKNTFLPRFGFAYQWNPQTVIRGGIGLFAGFLGQRRGDVFPNGWSQTTTVGTTTNAFGAPDPEELGRRAPHHRRSWSRSATRTAGSRASGRRSTSSTRTRTSRSSSAGRSASSASCRAASCVDAAYVGNYGYDIEIVRNINALPNQYLNTDNSRTAAMNANNTFLTGAVANPFAGLLPGTSLNNPTIARSQLLRPYPAVPGHPDDEQRRQVLVQLRPGRPAEAVLEGLHAGPLLHLLALGAGDGVPERGRRRADPDDLGPGRAAPAVRQRHPRAARSGRAAGSCPTRAGS